MKIVMASSRVCLVSSTRLEGMEVPGRNASVVFDPKKDSGTWLEPEI